MAAAGSVPEDDDGGKGGREGGGGGAWATGSVTTTTLDKFANPASRSEVCSNTVLEEASSLITEPAREASFNSTS